ncbi:MAG TPA: MBL fold metallo-hydrolase, partial [Dehalococcoidia bacterium]|nr:MBL fold metallo-hydrolase [Dehalococcoidia bacterium]
MKIIPFVHEGLGNSSYLVGLDDGRALVIDPDRSVARYVRAAEERGWRITGAVETHLHADFISGARELAATTDATLFVPSGAQPRFPHRPVAPGETLQVDGVELTAVGSPGHTPEHLAYVLRAASGPPRLFSGGSLIVGGAARTDLIAPEMTEPLTRAQYRTITSAFADLPDETLLLPTHGGGSFCSAGEGGGRTSTLGAERAHNPLLAFTDEDEFTRWFPTTFPGTPAYYARMRQVNQAGPRLRSEIAPPAPMPPAAFRDATRRPGALVVDTRSVEAFAAGHIAGSISIPFREAFAVWLGWLAPADPALLIVHDDAPLSRIADECLLVGYERFGGALEGGVEAWERAGFPLASATLTGAEGAR